MTTNNFASKYKEIGGFIKYVKDKDNFGLTADQARYIYKNIEQKGIFNENTIKQEIEEDRLHKNDIDNVEEVSPSNSIINNDFNRENVITSQM